MGKEEGKRVKSLMEIFQGSVNAREGEAGGLVDDFCLQR